MLKSVPDVRPAQWILDGLDAPNTHRVGAIVPRGFERYARIFHPGWRLEGRERVRARWADVATPTGCRAHALMQWQSIAASANDILDPPDEGTLPPEVARPLREILSLHTGPEPCWLAIWRGFGGDYSEHVPETRFIETAWREWDLFRAPLAQMDMSFYPFVYYGVHQTANMVWPDDRSWCLATEIDLDTSYIGGCAALIRDLLESEHLEVWPSTPEDDITFGSDTINPAPKKEVPPSGWLASILRRARFIVAGLMIAGRGWRQRRDGDSTLPTAHLYVAKSRWRKRN